jgi:phosphoribosylformimino-5-aminoimidazole carboxamide ribotide isomerase
MLRRHGFRLWIDAGIRQLPLSPALKDGGIEGIVAGLETLANPQVLGQLCRDQGDRIIFSLDLQAGTPLGNPTWTARDPFGIAGEAVAQGVRRLLVLDLACVGQAGGPATAALCAQIAQTYPQVTLAAGGGVRDVKDLRLLEQCGVQAVLVASALHDGALRREDLALAADDVTSGASSPDPDEAV